MADCLCDVIESERWTLTNDFMVARKILYMISKSLQTMHHMGLVSLSYLLCICEVCHSFKPIAGKVTFPKN